MLLYSKMAKFFQYSDPLEQLYFRFAMEHGGLFGQRELLDRVNQGIRDNYEGRPSVVDDPYYLQGYAWASQFRPAPEDRLSNIDQASMDNIVSFLDPQTAENLALTSQQNRESVESAIRRGFKPQEPKELLTMPMTRSDRREDDQPPPPATGQGRVSMYELPSMRFNKMRR
jgi:hypothetical protein